jgi:hypothetical protein
LKQECCKCEKHSVDLSTLLDLEGLGIPAT